MNINEFSDWRDVYDSADTLSCVLVEYNTVKKLGRKITSAEREGQYTSLSNYKWTDEYEEKARRIILITVTKEEAENNLKKLNDSIDEKVEEIDRKIAQYD